VRVGELPVVVIPSEGQEAARDLVRAGKTSAVI
jgi:hypothetical protein